MNHASQIAEVGYTRIEQGIGKHCAALLLAELKTLLEKQDAFPVSGRVPFLNRGHDILYNLQNKSFLFLSTLLRLGVLRSVLMELLNDSWYRDIPPERPNYILRGYIARSSGPEPLPLHIDSFVPGSGRLPWALQAALILEDQSVDNGCTMVIPGSHRADRYATQEDWVSAVPILSQSGDLVVWDSRLWHGAAANRESGTRWSLIGTFCRWWVKQSYDIPRSLPQSFYQHLSDEEKAVLGFCSLPPKDETERVDLKSGYDSLPSTTEGL